MPIGSQAHWRPIDSLPPPPPARSPLDFFANNTHLGVFAGVVGVDHYHTDQGMPCINGRPQEFEHQDAFAIATKAQFPGTRVLEYRITGLE